jgi:hypothetical protein
LGYSATYRRTRRLVACLPVLCAAVAVPSAALARSPRSGGSGGAGLGGSGGSSSSTATTPSPATNPTAGTTVQVVHLTGVVNASGDGITLTAAASGTQGHPLTISGEAPSSDSGATIDLESAKSSGGLWTKIATAVIGPGGAFTAQWTPATSAQMDLRAVLAPGIVPTIGTSSTNGGGGLSGSSASTASSQLQTAPLTIPIFRNAIATLYGPGFWGHHTACGERLTRATLGVASRTLKCGTRVGVLYKGREITVPVIDRGPFGNGASWDLTMATAKALGIKETVTLGTLAPAPAPAFAARS